MKMRQAFDALSLGMVLFHGLSTHAADVTDPLSRIESIDVLHYKFSINASEAVRGTEMPMTETVVLKTRIDTDSIQLHYNPKTMTVKTMKVVGDPWASFSTVVLPAIGKASDSFLKVTLSNKVPKNTKLSLTFSYSVKMRETVDQNEGGILKTTLSNGNILLNSHSWPYFGRNWAFLDDHPTDPATVEFEFKTPDGMIALSNGKEVSKSSKRGETTSRWKMSDPIQSYNFTFMIGHFNSYKEQNEKMSPVLYWDPSYTDSASADKFIAEMTRVKGALNLYSKIFGAYPYEKLAFGIVPHPFNMESTTMITLVNHESMVHELIHHWWGDTAKMWDWNELWLSEGFTTYFTGYFDEVSGGKNSACTKTTGDLRIETSPIDPLSIFDDTPYCKGASTVDALRDSIAGLAGLKKGEPLERKLFESVMGELFQAFKFKNITSEDLQRALSTTLKKRIETVGGTVTQTQIDSMLSTWWTSWIQ